jgi:signal transduction histidine kinase
VVFRNLSAALKKMIPKTTGGILAGIMLSALIPLLLLQTTIYIVWYQTRIQTEMDANLEFARSVAWSFESYVQDLRRQLHVLGNAIESDPAFSMQKAGTLLSILKNQYDTVLRFSIVSNEGTILASSDPALVGMSVAERDYFLTIQSGREWGISDLNLGPLENRIQFDIAQKLQLHKKEKYLIVAVVDPESLGNSLLSLNRPAGGLFTIFDRSGTLVFFSGESGVQHSSWEKHDAILRKAMQGEEAVGTILYPVDSKDHIAARVPIRQLGWMAGASRSMENVMAPIYRNLVWVAILNGVIVLISIAGALVLRSFFIRKLDSLRAHARFIAGGNFSSKVEVGNPVELVELEKSFNTMAEQIESRQNSLQRAVNELTRSNQELEQFAYVASHDLQEPLRVITGFVQLIDKKYRGRLDEDADRYMTFITEAVHRLQELIRDLLTYSRLGRLEPKLEATNASMAAQAAIQNMSLIVEEAKATVTLDSLPFVQADGQQMIQLFQNLIHNGIKFRRTVPPILHISAQPHDSMWIFAVRDNGIGIEPQYWSQVFTMFKRLHSRKDYPGTGIGLAICKKIVERHGGRIWLDSRPGEGSTFFFTFKAVGEQ